MKRVVVLLLTVLLAIGPAAAFAAGGDGDTATVTLKVTSNSGAMTAKVSFSYDTSALEFVSAHGENTWIAPQNGNGSFGFASADSVIPVGNIGTITFRIKRGAAPGQYPVNAVVTKAVDTNYRNASLSVSGGTVTINSSQDPSSRSDSDYPPQETPPQYASGYPCSGYTTVEKLNVREVAGSDAKVINRIQVKGTYLTVLGETYDQSGTQWYKIKLSSGETGYAMSRYITIDNGYPPASSDGFSNGGLAKTIIERVIIRAQPSTESRRVFRIEYAGTIVNVLGQEYDSTGKLWVKAVTNDGYQGYIQSRYLENTNGTDIELQSMNDGQRGTFSTVNAELVRGKRFNVYSGPGKKYLRGANGRAVMSTNDSAYVYGKEKGWVLVQYYISSDHWRFGYVSESLIAHGTVPDLAFTRTKGKVSVATTITDDPLYSQSPLTTISAGTKITILGQLDNWTYIEVGTVRGFIPSNVIQ